MTSEQTFERIRAIIYELKQAGGDEALETEAFAKLCQERMLEASDLVDTLGPMVEMPAVFETHLDATDVVVFVGPGSAVQNLARLICAKRGIVAVTKYVRHADPDEVQRYFVEGVYALPTAARE